MIFRNEGFRAVLDRFESALSPATLASMPLYNEFLTTRPYWNAYSDMNGEMKYFTTSGYGSCTNRDENPKYHSRPSAIFPLDFDLLQTRILRRNSSCSRRGSRLCNLLNIRSGTSELRLPTLLDVWMAPKFPNMHGYTAPVSLV